MTIITGTLLEDLHAFLCAEVAWCGISRYFWLLWFTCGISMSEVKLWQTRQNVYAIHIFPKF